MVWMLTLAVQGLWSRRGRLGPLLALLILSSATLTLCFGIGQGTDRARRGAATALISGDINIAGFFKVHPDTLTPVIVHPAAVKAVVGKTLPECRFRDRMRGMARMRAGSRTARSFVLGLDSAREKDAAAALEITRGRWDNIAETNTALLSEEMAQRLRVGLGDVVSALAITLDGRRNSVDLRVGGILAGGGLLAQTAGVVVSNQTLQNMQGLQAETLSMVQLICPTTVSTPEATARLRSELRAAGFNVLAPTEGPSLDRSNDLLREGWSGQRLDVTDWVGESAFLEFLRVALLAFTGLLLMLTLSVVAAFSVVVSGVSVQQRERELGTLRAIGLSRRALVGLVTLEGLLIGVAAGLFGSGVGAVLGQLLTRTALLPDGAQMLLFSRHLPLLLTASSYGESVAAVSIACAVGSIGPALWASRRTPRLAMESRE